MSHVIAFVGKSNSGKTTLIKKLIPEFKRRGYKVCVIKHIHGILQLDKRGKDTYKFAKAGADMVIMENKNTLALIKKIRTGTKSCARRGTKCCAPTEIIKTYAKEYDLVIVEGFKKSNLPQIWVTSGGKDVKINKKKVIAAVGKKIKGSKIPCFDKNDFKALADFIEKER